MTYKIGQSISWYKATWDGTLNPIVFAASKGFAFEPKNFGKGRKIAVFLSKGNNFWLAYDLEDLGGFGKYLIELWNKNPQVFNKHKQNYYQYLFALRKYYKKIQKDKLPALSNNKIIDLYLNFFNAYVKFIGWSAFCEAVIVALQPLIDRIVSSCLKKYPVELCQSLIAPNWFSFLKKKELSELKTALKISQTNKLEKIFRQDRGSITDYLNSSRGEQVKSVIKSLNSIQRNYYWVRNNYIKAEYLTLNFFIKDVKEILRQFSFDPQKIKDEINKTRNYKRQKRVAFNKIKLTSQDKFYINLLDEVGFLQDTRKRMYIESIQYFDYLFNEISRRIKIKGMTLKFLLPEEVIQSFDIKKINKLKSLAEKRQKNSAVVFKNGKITVETNDQKLSKIRNWLTPKSKIIKELKGTPASVGPKIRGICRVLFSAQEINKIEKGNILVTGSTAPDYLPAMKKAKAILTEKGGLTSHAAIVSRELGVPCIVGILNLLDIIKDEDLVEVDPNKGIVKIL